MSQATGDLVHEHEAILSALHILDRIIDGAEIENEIDPDDMTTFVDFLKEFADKCHHGKEEGILFPAMVAAGVPESGGPIGVMLQEHAEGRRLIGEMTLAMAGETDVERLSKAARDYAILLRGHIQKENTVLFPMADRVLDDIKLAEIYQAFVDHEEKVIGHGRHEELHATLDRLNEKYS
ncbi:MAG: hemerythrin domain-containing protein [Anaerolineaceae bacterium]|nr:hemerythrin domain-containing protein [Anaerolineaceae bacterium]